MRQIFTFLFATLLFCQANAQQFTNGNLVILRVGDGSAALTNAGTAVFLDEYTPAGVFVQSVPMPVTAAGANKRLVLSGTSTSEGLITTSADNRYVLVSGYDAATGTAAVSSTTSATVNRSVARIDKNLTIDLTTALTDAATSNSIRSAVSTNGTDIWVTGGGGGIRYATLGATTSLQLSTTITNIRQANIFNNQLLVSAASGAIRAATVGTGTPTTNGQTITNLPGFPTSGGSPYGFFMSDLDAGVAGVDVLYVADDAGGVTKYSLVAGSWVSNGTVGTGSDVYRGLTGFISGGTITLYATRRNSELVTITDASGYNAAFTGSFTLLATAATNTAFRGVTPAPSLSVLPVRISNFTIEATGNDARLNWDAAVVGNGASFEVEHSTDGRSFGRVGAVSASSQQSRYTYTDALGIEGTHYYRLKFIEQDGSYTYSNTLRISRQGKNTLHIGAISSLRSELVIEISNPASQPTIITITDAVGRQLLQRSLTLQPGTATYRVPFATANAQVYYLSVNHTGGRDTRAFTGF